jgi:DNA-binding HxlR family transcriptional regulator
MTFDAKARFPDLDSKNLDECRVVLEVLDRVGDKWTVMVVGVLAAGPVRFNAIQRSIPGLSHRMLTATLRGLERDGLVERRAYPTSPPKVEYELTEFGHSLIKPLQGLATWALSSRATILSARMRFDAGREAGTRR